jgi:Zn-finger nucleic acid-binding protein
MLRRNFGRISGIIVDVCTAHGTWFDTGELPRILAFVGQGGIERAQAVDRKEKQSLALERTSLVEPQNPSFQLKHDPSTLEEMLSAAQAFVRWVEKLLP